MKKSFSLFIAIMLGFAINLSTVHAETQFHELEFYCDVNVEEGAVEVFWERVASEISNKHIDYAHFLVRKDGPWGNTLEVVEQYRPEHYDPADFGGSVENVITFENDVDLNVEPSGSNLLSIAITPGSRYYCAVAYGAYPSEGNLGEPSGMSLYDTFAPESNTPPEPSDETHVLDFSCSLTEEGVQLAWERVFDESSDYSLNTAHFQVRKDGANWESTLEVAENPYPESYDESEKIEEMIGFVNDIDLNFESPGSEFIPFSTNTSGTYYCASASGETANPQYVEIRSTDDPHATLPYSRPSDYLPAGYSMELSGDENKMDVNEDGYISRAEFVAAYLKFKNADIDASETQYVVSDLEKGSWYYPYMRTILNSGGGGLGIPGQSDIIKPADPVTRGQAAHLISLHIVGHSPNSPVQQFADIPPESKYFYHVWALYDYGLESGDDMFLPDEPLTAETLEMWLAKSPKITIASIRSTTDSITASAEYDLKQGEYLFMNCSKNGLINMELNRMVSSENTLTVSGLEPDSNYECIVQITNQPLDSDISGSYRAPIKPFWIRTSNNEGLDLLLAPPAGPGEMVLKDADSFDTPFEDVDPATLEGRAAIELFRRGVIQGVGDTGRFQGDDILTRVGALKFLLYARYGGVQTDDVGTVERFPDTKKEDWFFHLVENGFQLEIISGHPNGSLDPGGPVRVSHFLKMLAKTFDLEEGLSYSYADVEMGSWYESYAGLAEKYDLFPNNEPGLLYPGKEMTRYDVAVAMYQFLAKR